MYMCIGGRIKEQDIQLKLALFVQVQEKLQIFVTGTHV